MRKTILFLLTLSILLCSCSKEANDPLADIKFNVDSISVYCGHTFQIIVTGTDEKIQYMSDNDEIASVESSGVVLGNKVGTTNIMIFCGDYLVRHLPVTIKSNYSFIPPYFQSGISVEETEKGFGKPLTKRTGSAYVTWFSSFDETYSYKEDEASFYSEEYVYNYDLGRLMNVFVGPLSDMFSSDIFDMLEERYDYVDKSRIKIVGQNKQEIGYTDAYIFQTLKSDDKQFYVVMREVYYYDSSANQPYYRAIIYSTNDSDWLYASSFKIIR